MGRCNSHRPWQAALQEADGLCMMHDTEQLTLAYHLVADSRHAYIFERWDSYGALAVPIW